MCDREPTECQLHLFQLQLAWDEFPREVRQRIAHLLAMLCVEAADDHQPSETGSIS